MEQQQIATKQSLPASWQTDERQVFAMECMFAAVPICELSLCCDVGLWPQLAVSWHAYLYNTFVIARETRRYAKKTRQQRTVRFRLHRAHFTRSTMSSPNNRCWGRLRLCRSINSRSCTCSSWRWNGLCDTLGHHHQHVRYRHCCAQLDIVHDLGLPVEVPSLLHQTSRFLVPLKHALREVKGDQIQICIETT